MTTSLNKMAPLSLDSEPELNKKKETKIYPELCNECNKSDENKREKQEIIWFNVIAFIIAHIIWSQYFLHFWLTLDWPTYIFTWVWVLFSIMGISAGVHRLWSHKSYKANAPLRFLLMLCNSAFFSNCIYAFVRDHRVHHKYTDTDADPHNSKRGFFYCHMGWLMVKRLPLTKKRIKEIDMSDIEQDKIAMFQKDYYYILMPLFTFILPTLIPFYFWGKDPWEAFCVCGVVRIVTSLHGLFTVNSFAHMWGSQPYDNKTTTSRQNPFVAFWTCGDGWHNYHHTFPWDYKASEFPYHLNLTTAFIDLFAKIGWAWDLKTVKPDVIARRAALTGDGSRLNDVPKTEKCVELSHSNIWGWDDKELTDKHKEVALILVQRGTTGQRSL
uniref:Acyl-CoA desaturase n=1 Tax=Lygus hesperus TaxID=30085 RepID=A0A146L637_LYGHE